MDSIDLLIEISTKLDLLIQSQNTILDNEILLVEMINNINTMLLYVDILIIILIVYYSIKFFELAKNTGRNLSAFRRLFNGR